MTAEQLFNFAIDSFATKDAKAKEVNLIAAFLQEHNTPFWEIPRLKHQLRDKMTLASEYVNPRVSPAILTGIIAFMSQFFVGPCKNPIPPGRNV